MGYAMPEQGICGKCGQVELLYASQEDEKPDICENCVIEPILDEEEE